MKKVVFTSFIILLISIHTAAQTPEEIYAVSSESVKLKMDENKKNGLSPILGITAQHVFKIKKPDNLLIADLDVHIHEAPGMIKYAMNLNLSWSRVKSIEFDCNASVTIEEIKEHFAQINVTIVKDKVNYIVQ